ncbi:MAG: T9SS type B sorting domain-containing protein [Ferruginibacter sp.]
MIQQLDHTGGVGFTKAFALAGKKLMLNSIRQLPNGNLVVTGTYTDPVIVSNRLLLASLDTDGTLLWCKSLNYAGYEGIAICSDPVNGIGFCGQSNQYALYGRLDNAGNLVWLQQLSLGDYGDVIGMENESFYNWYVACNSVQAGKHTGLLLSINPINGILQWANQYGGAASNQQFIFSALAVTNLRARVAGIFSTGTGAYKPCRLNVNSTSPTESMQVVDIPSAAFDTTALIALDVQNEVLSFVANKTDATIYAIKTVPEGAVSNLWDWAKKFTTAGTHRFLHTQQTFDAGLAICSDLPVAPGTTQALILKTDSTGTIKNCEGTGFAFTLDIIAEDAIPYTTIPISPAAALVTENALVNTTVVPTDFSCKTLTCPIQPPEDTCLTSFIRRYSSADFCDLGTDLLPRSNDVIFAGIMRNDRVKVSEEEGTLGRMDNRGKLLERKKIKLGGATTFRQLLQLRDGNFIVLGYSSYQAADSRYDTSYTTITKFTPSLQLIWNRSFPPPSTYAAANNIIEGTDGSLFINYVAGTDVFCLRTGVIKLDNQGNLLWINEFSATNQCLASFYGSMIQDDQYLYVVSWTNGDASNLFIKIDKNTGLPVLTKKLVMPDAYQWRGCSKMAILGDKIAMLGLVSFTNHTSRNTIVLMNKNGVMIKNICLSLFNDAMALTMVGTGNSDLVLTGSSGAEALFIRLDSNLNILYSKKTATPGMADIAVKEDAAGAILSIGFFFYNDDYKEALSYKKFTYDGRLGSCFADSLVLATEQHSVDQTTVSPIITPASITLSVLPYSEASYSLQNAQLLCAQVATCTAISLQAPSPICDTLVHVAKVIRNTGCTLPVSFTQSNANIKIISSTDTTVSFKMLQSGSTMLVASIFNGCKWLRDSVQINSTVGTTGISLGDDTSICPGNTLTLRPAKNYFSYAWSDGSTADTLKVTGPGTYFVTVTNACADTLADTVVVMAAPPVSINLGTDKIKCNDEKVLLSAPAGFISYSWGPAYQLTPVTDSQVTVAPLRDTSYFIKAEKTPGCFAFDTIAVKVNTSAPIHLGTDKSFCTGDSIVLNAGSGFTSYTWNTGAVSQKITVFFKGLYFVSATNQLGCVSKDTVAVTVFANPAVHLGNDFSLCKGSTQTLDAGVFSHYLWNDLSTSQTLQVTTTGLYAVTVTDQHHCVGSDTVVVAGILPLPANFLPADTLMCQYETIQLAARGDFTSYVWSTNNIDKTIAVKTPGLYWLQVKDRNNCVGRDSVAIGLKECVAGFYIPSAFTPNHDGLNDVFKPILLGNVLQYRFLVHNRYGQVVFETTDLKAGWDGKVNGIDQNSHGFTWVCWYLLQGSTAKMEKGNVMLLR